MNKSCPIAPFVKLFVAALALLLSASAVSAQTYWNASATSSTWNTANNWVPATVPGSSTTGVITNTGTVEFNTGIYNNGFTGAITANNPQNIQSIIFDTATTLGTNNPYTSSIGNNFYLSPGTWYLTNGGSIQSNSTYTGIGAISGAIDLATTTSTGTYTFTNNSANITSFLTFQTSITTTGGASSYTLNLNGSNANYNNNIYGNISGGTAALTIVKSGAGTWALTGANTYTGGTVLGGGTLVVNSAAALGTTGNVDFTANSTLAFGQGASAVLSDISSRLKIENGVAATFDLTGNGYTLGSSFGNTAAGAASTGGITLTGAGTNALTLNASAAETYTGATTVNAETLVVDVTNYTGNNYLSSSSSLVLGGGILKFNLKAAGTNTYSQTFNTTTLNNGYGQISWANNSATNTGTVVLGTLTRNVGSILYYGATGVTTQATNSGAGANDAGGVVRGLILNGNDFTSNTGGTLGQVSYTTNNAANTWTSATANYTTGAAVTGSAATGAGTTTINSLHLNNGASNSFTITNTLAVNDGIIFGNSIGGHASTISGGTLTAGSANELIIFNNNNQSSLASGYNVVASSIGDNGGAVSVTLGSAQGTLYITGNETYTGNTYVSSKATVNLTGVIGNGSSAGTTYLNGGTLQIGNGSGFSTGDIKGGINLNNGTLSFNRTDAGGYTLSSTVTSTAGLGTITNVGSANVSVAIAANSFLNNISTSAAGNLILTSTGDVTLNGVISTGITNGAVQINSGTFLEQSGGTTANLNIYGGELVWGSSRNVIGTINVSNNGGANTGGLLYAVENQLGGGNNGRLILGSSSAGVTTTLNLGNGGTIITDAGQYGVQIGNGGTTVNTTIFNQTGGYLSVGLIPNGGTTLNTFYIGNGSAGQTGIAAYYLSGGTAVFAGAISANGGTTGGSGQLVFGWTGGTLTTPTINMTSLTGTDGTNSLTGALINGGGTLSPGEVSVGNYAYTGTTSITGSYVVTSNNAVLKLNLGGTTAATNFHDLSTKYDNISVTGSVVLGGTLNIGLINSYSPLTSNTFTLVKTGASTTALTGSFTNLQVGRAGSGTTSGYLLTGTDGLHAATITYTQGTASASGSVTLSNYNAATFNTYTGATGTNWDAANAASWSSFDPGSGAKGATAVFSTQGSSTTPIAVGLGSSRNVQGIIFSSSNAGQNYTITPTGSGSITLDNTANSASAYITDSSAAGNQNTINGPITLNSNLTGTVTNSTNVLTLGGTISGTGTTTLTKTGLGTLALLGSNTYGGATTISGGTISTSNLANGGTASGIGNSSNAATNLVLDSGTLQYTGGDASTDRLFTMTSNGATLDASGTGTITYSNTGTVVVSGGGAPNFTLTGTNTGANIFAPVIGDGSGTTALVKNGVGQWVLTGTNTYSGGTTINAGTLDVRNNSALGNTSGAVTVADGAELTLDGSGTTIGQSITLNGTGTIANSGNLVNLANSNTVSGTVYANAASLITASGTSTLTLSGSVYAGASGTDNPLTFGSSTQTGTINVTGVIHDYATGGGGVIVAGGLVTFSNTNTTSVQETVTVNAGELDLNATGGKATGSSNLIVNGGTVKVLKSNQIYGNATNGGATINTGGTLLFAGGNAANNGFNQTSVSGGPASVTLAGGTLAIGTTTPSTAGSPVSQSFGKLTQTATSIIDFGSGNTNVTISFSSTGTFAGGANAIKVYDWDSGQSDVLSITGFSSALASDVTFYSDNGMTNVGTGNYIGTHVTPVPEPSTIFASVCLLGLLGWSQRRQLREALKAPLAPKKTPIS